ncbi:TPA: hypothetical protein ACWV4T_001092 [Salmonella enterica subsp. enterica serovar Muenchen]
MATTPTPSQPKIVLLPYVSAVDPKYSQIHQWTLETENKLLDRVKEALNDAGVAWIDLRTKERSKPQPQPHRKPADTDNGEAYDDAQ